MSEWSKYSDVLKEGFVKCKDYLRNRYDLLEKASVTLKDSFSVDFILSYCLDVNKFPDGSFKDRQMFTKEVFEIYFGYCKNILLYFDIYSQKSITETTPQVVNYLSKIPNFSDHLALIGYHYQDDCNEWKYTESRLTKERREILQLITVCCCLGHNYLDSPFKFLSLTIFEQREKSCRQLVQERICEFCNFELDIKLGTCSVCDQEINNMNFFQDWIFSFSTVNVENYKDVNERVENKVENKKKILNKEPKIDTDSWKCQQCTLNNPMTCVSCIVCYTLRENVTINTDKSNNKNEEYHQDRIHYDDFINDTDPCLEIKVNVENNKRIIERVENKGENKHEILNNQPKIDTDSWKCQQCTLNNPMTCVSCIVCYNMRESIAINRDKSNNKNEQRQSYVPKDLDKGKNYETFSQPAKITGTRDTIISIGNDQNVKESRDFISYLLVIWTMFIVFILRLFNNHKSQ